MQVRDVMTREVLALRPTETVREGVEKLAARGVGGAPVVDDADRIVGVLSEGDVLEALKTANRTLRMLMPPEIAFGIDFVEIIHERDALEAFGETAQLRVEDIMTREVVSVPPDAPVAEAIKRMVTHRVHRLPVVEDDRVVGVVTRGDVLRGFFRRVGDGA